MDQPGLFLPGDDVQGHAGAAQHGGLEFPRVRRLPESARRDGADLLGAGGPGLPHQGFHGRDAGLDRLVAQAAGKQRLGAEADHLLPARQDFESAVLVHSRHQQLDGVGADVDGGERLLHGGQSAATDETRRECGVKSA